MICRHRNECFNWCCTKCPVCYKNFWRGPLVYGWCKRFGADFICCLLKGRFSFLAEHFFSFRWVLFLVSGTYATCTSNVLYEFVPCKYFLSLMQRYTVLRIKEKAHRERSLIEGKLGSPSASGWERLMMVYVYLQVYKQSIKRGNQLVGSLILTWLRSV